MERIQTITMPKWGMTMTEGKVAGWLKAEGEVITAGEQFVEIETEKITNVVEAETGGILRRILVQPGQSAACGAPIAILAGADVPDADLDAVAASASVADAVAGGLSERRVEAAGLFLNVVSAGTGDAHPLILLHGFGSDSAAWMFVQEPLGVGRPVHAIDLPSHGASDVDSNLRDLDQLTDTAAAAIDGLAPGPVHLAGHSLGGRIALRLAARMGDRARSLALIAPAGMGSVNPEFVQAFLRAEKRRAMKEALRMLVADEESVTPEMVERALSARRIDGVPDALKAIADACLGSAAADAFAEDRAAATAAVLVIWGAEDRVIPAPETGATVLSGIGHMPMMEAAGRVAQLMADHISAAQ
jgi:pyruvate dehydrogenase E2 component (dihydrolipoamide acetyltransferase)